MSTHQTPPSSDRWPSLYSAERASWDNAQRMGALFIPIIVVVLVLFIYLSSYIFIVVSAGFSDGNMTAVEAFLLSRGTYALVIPIVIVSLLVPVMIAGGLFMSVLHASSEFFTAFYNPPEDTNAPKLIMGRLLGIIPLPAFLAYFISYPVVVINIKDVAEGKFDLAKQSAHWLGGPALLIVLDGAGLYLQRGNQFSRTLGPGIHFLDRYETVKDVIDLRRQTIRSGQPGMPPQIGGRTKDGIKIFFNVEATFNIVRPPIQEKKADKPKKKSAKKTTAQKEAEELFLMGSAVDSGDLESIRKAYESTTVRYMRKADDRKYTEAKWRDGVWGTISGDLAKYITKHYLDELLVFEGPDNGDFLSSATAIPQNIEMPKAGHLLSWQELEKLRQSMDEFLRKNRGITLTDLRIVDFELPPEVNEQRLRVLEAEMTSRVKRIKGNSVAEHIIVREEARTRAQQDLIASFADSLASVDPVNFVDSVLLSFSSILSQSMDDPSSSAYMARDTFDTLEQLREFLSQKGKSYDDSDSRKISDNHQG